MQGRSWTLTILPAGGAPGWEVGTRTGRAEGAQEQPQALPAWHRLEPRPGKRPQRPGRARPARWLPSIRSPSALVKPLRACGRFAGGDPEVRRRRGCSCGVTSAGCGARRPKGEILSPRGKGRGGVGTEAAAASRGLGTRRRVPASQAALPVSSARGLPPPGKPRGARSSLGPGPRPRASKTRSSRRRACVHAGGAQGATGHRRRRASSAEPQGQGTQGTRRCLEGPRFRRRWRLGARGGAHGRGSAGTRRREPSADV